MTREIINISGVGILKLTERVTNTVIVKKNLVLKYAPHILSLGLSNSVISTNIKLASWGDILPESPRGSYYGMSEMTCFSKPVVESGNCTVVDLPVSVKNITSLTSISFDFTVNKNNAPDLLSKNVQEFGLYMNDKLFSRIALDTDFIFEDWMEIDGEWEVIVYNNIEEPYENPEGTVTDLTSLSSTDSSSIDSDISESSDNSSSIDSLVDDVNTLVPLSGDMLLPAYNILNLYDGFSTDLKDSLDFSTVGEISDIDISTGNLIILFNNSNIIRIYDGISNVLLSSFTHPTATSLSGLTVIGGNLITCGSSPEKRIYIHIGVTNIISSSYLATHNSFFGTLSNDGVNLMDADQIYDSIYTHSGSSPTISQTTNISSWYLNGIGWDGVNIICALTNINEIIKLNGKTSTVLNTLSFNNPRCVTFKL